MSTPPNDCSNTPRAIRCMRAHCSRRSAYADWRTANARKAGRDFTFDVPTDLELLRAACGADGRLYTYGSWFSPAWQKAAGSHPLAFPEPPLSFPVDE